MDWFSLDTDIVENKKIRRALNKHGIEAYGLYTLILPMVAQSIDFKNDDRGVLEVPGPKGVIEYLSFVADLEPEKVEKILDTFAELELICPESWEENVVFLPKLLERKQVQTYLDKQEGGSKGGKRSKPPRSPSSSPSRSPRTDKDIDKDIDKEKDTDLHNKNGKSESLPPPKPEQLKEYWNEKAKANDVFEDSEGKNDIGIVSMSDKRKRKLKTRRQEPEFSDNWQQIVDNFFDSNFLLESRSKGSGEYSFAGPNWILENDDNYVKVLEGKYNNGKSTNPDAEALSRAMGNS